MLAGGGGRRMGGVDKGLQFHEGRTLVSNAVQRLAPQVGQVALNANRHLEIHGALGVPVWTDAHAAGSGPLAGFLTGLQNCGTHYLATVPCDAPLFPHDLVMRLAAALEGGHAELAMAVTRAGAALAPQPVFCLISRDVHPGLDAFLANGGRKVAEWVASLRHVEVVFEDADAFANLNTYDDLKAVRGGRIAT